MAVKPDAFVFVDGMTDLTWDEPTACGIPVLHGAGFLSPHHGSEPIECPFIPVWDTELSQSLVESRKFVSGYCGRTQS